MKPFDHDVAIVGAGISGLAAAHALQLRRCDVAVYERAPTIGGRIHTERRDGFLVEHGPNSLVSPAPAAEDLVAALGLGGDRVERGQQVRQRYLVRDGRARALPVSPLRFFASSYFTLAGRLRLLAEPFVPVVPRDESVAAFVRRRFGDELARHVFDPLVGGLYAGDPELLSIEALFPHLKRLEREQGSVVRGVLASMRAGRRGFDPGSRRLFSFRDGMAALPTAIGDTLRGRLHCGRAVEAVTPCPGGWQLALRQDGQRQVRRARAVVLATPAYVTATLLGGLDDAVAARLASLHHPPLSVVGLAYRRRDIGHALDGLGVLSPRVEQRAVLGMIFSSTLFAGRAPDDHALLTAYVGGARQPELALLPRDELVAAVHAEVRALLELRHGAQPVFTTTRLWRRGLPQPGLDHAQRLSALGQLQQEWPSLVVTGNYTAGVSTAACIAGGEAAAARVAAWLAPPRGDADRPDAEARDRFNPAAAGVPAPTPRADAAPG